MVRSGWFIFRMIAALVLIGLLVAGGGMLYRAGQAQGYAMGLAAAGQEQAPPTLNNGPLPYYGMAPYAGMGWGRPLFFPFGPLIGFFVVGGLFFLFFGGIGALFRRRAWAHAPGGYGPWGPPPWAGQPQPPASGESAPPPSSGEQAK